MKEQNFRFRESYAKIIKSMTDKQAGEFIKGVCGYVFEGKPLETKDEFLKGAFIYMQNALDAERDSRKFGKVGAFISMERQREQQIFEAASAAASVAAASVIIAVEQAEEEAPTVQTQKRKRHYKRRKQGV